MGEEPKYVARRYQSIEQGLLQPEDILAYIIAHPPKTVDPGHPDQQYREKVADNDRIKSDLENLKP